MILEITCLDEFNIAKFSRNFIGVGIDAVNQNAGKQEIREHDNALVAKLHGFAQARVDARVGNTGIADFGAAKTHAFLQHARDLVNVGVGVRIVGPAPHDHQQGVFT